MNELKREKFRKVLQMINVVLSFMLLVMSILDIAREIKELSLMSKEEEE